MLLNVLGREDLLMRNGLPLKGRGEQLLGVRLSESLLMAQVPMIILIGCAGGITETPQGNVHHTIMELDVTV